MTDPEDNLSEVTAPVDSLLAVTEKSVITPVPVIEGAFITPSIVTLPVILMLPFMVTSPFIEPPLTLKYSVAGNPARLSESAALKE